MTIKVGDRLPAGTVSEYIEVEGNGCSIGPNTFKVEDLVKGARKDPAPRSTAYRAFTPTCSAKHLCRATSRTWTPSKAKGVDGCGASPSTTPS